MLIEEDEENITTEVSTRLVVRITYSSSYSIEEKSGVISTPRLIVNNSECLNAIGVKHNV